ncbi:hypothetical protein SELR_pSRC500180 (plasmid) [Selenomonas ruminantium subsp. lactilytica TAM6421]|uniref:Uncharacterized protein n=1 Tax=Selenomonas ruminantium subsp. lactilytica (strain NBRC 103574 / TAM6421) TaxID=927704 RepID=I0GWQ5_SELRL|nr:hypothetical protein [Selenomonas ruminantium]BAL85192.1 hypothetical protein SELR_pSRC500180 [Selenomonas ruminantium subsp. lactilytica TAM6421]
MTTATRRAAATRYQHKLEKLFTNAPETKREAANLLIKRAAFLLATEDELQSLMQQEGPIGVYENGSQSGVCISAYLKSYTMANQQLLSTIKQLTVFLPADDSASQSALNKFFADHK